MSEGESCNRPKIENIICVKDELGGGGEPVCQSRHAEEKKSDH